MAWNSDIILYANVPCNRNNYPWFTSKAACDGWMAGFALRTLTRQSYQRESRYTAKVAVNYEDIENVNYIGWRNRDSGSSTFYGRIVEKLYINPLNTQITYETDWFLTEMGNFTLQECFVVREHVLNDWSEKRTKYEGDDYGGQTIDQYQDLGDASTSLAFCAAYDPSSLSGDGQIINNVFTGGKYVVGPTASVMGSINTLVGSYASLELADAIVGIWQVYTDFTAPGGRAAVTVNLPTTLDGYEPENAKCLTYPYVQIEVDNLAGTTKQYAFEDFAGGDSATFRIYGSGSVMPITGVAIPENYKGQSSNPSEGVENSDYLTCSFTGGAFSGWVFGNGAKAGSSIAASAAALANPATAPAGAAGLVESGLNVVQSLVKRPHGGTQSGPAFRFANSLPPFRVTVYVPKAEYAKRIDERFKMYGYDVSTTKVPNVNTRPVHNYVQTQNCVVTGPLTKVAMDYICAIFDGGVQLWRNGENWGDFSANNRG